MDTKTSRCTDQDPDNNHPIVSVLALFDKRATRKNIISYAKRLDYEGKYD